VTGRAGASALRLSRGQELRSATRHIRGGPVWAVTRGAQWNVVIQGQPEYTTAELMQQTSMVLANSLPLMDSYPINDCTVAWSSGRPNSAPGAACKPLRAKMLERVLPSEVSQGSGCGAAVVVLCGEAAAEAVAQRAASFGADVLDVTPVFISVLRAHGMLSRVQLLRGDKSLAGWVGLTSERRPPRALLFVTPKECGHPVLTLVSEHPCAPVVQRKASRTALRNLAVALEMAGVADLDHVQSLLESPPWGVTDVSGGPGGS
jgi:hypothetical protein